MGCNQRENEQYTLSQDNSVYAVNWTTGMVDRKIFVMFYLPCISCNHYT